LILIDDSLELAFKNYILKVKKFKLPSKTKFRDYLHKGVKKKYELPRRLLEND